MTIIPIKSFLINESIILIPLVLCITNFMGFGEYWIFSSIAIAYLLLFQKNIFLIDMNLIWLASFTLSYSFFLVYHDPLITVFTTIRYILIPVSFYAIGKYLSLKYPIIKITYFIVFFLTIFISLIPFLSNVYSVIKNGFMSIRNIEVFWSSAKVVSATIVGSSFALNMSFLPLLFINTQDRIEIKLKYFSFILFLIGLFAYMNIMTRTGIFITLISLIVIFVLMESWQKNKYLVYILLLGISMIFLLYIFGFFKWFEHTTYYYRFFGEIEEFKQIPRTTNWQLTFDGLFQYPLGGTKTKLTGNYAHNLWLDVGWRTGVIPLIPLLLFTFRYIITISKINQKKYYSVFFRSVIICVSLGFLLSFSVEPVMEGMFVSFCLFCLFFGVFDSVKKIRFI